MSLLFLLWIFFFLIFGKVLYNLYFFYREAKALLKEPVEDNSELKEELGKVRNMVEVARAKLSKKARAVGLMKRKLDQMPDRAELAQYQRRFVELSNEGWF